MQPDMFIDMDIRLIDGDYLYALIVLIRCHAMKIIYIKGIMATNTNKQASIIKSIFNMFNVHEIPIFWCRENPCTTEYDVALQSIIDCKPDEHVFNQLTGVEFLQSILTQYSSTNRLTVVCLGSLYNLSEIHSTLYQHMNIFSLGGGFEKTAILGYVNHEIDILHCSPISYNWSASSVTQTVLDRCVQPITLIPLEFVKYSDITINRGIINQIKYCKATKQSTTLMDLLSYDLTCNLFSPTALFVAMHPNLFTCARGFMKNNTFNRFGQNVQVVFDSQDIKSTIINLIFLGEAVQLIPHLHMEINNNIPIDHTVHVIGDILLRSNAERCVDILKKYITPQTVLQYSCAGRWMATDTDIQFDTNGLCNYVVDMFDVMAIANVSAHTIEQMNNGYTVSTKAKYSTSMNSVDMLICFEGGVEEFYQVMQTIRNNKPVILVCDLRENKKFFSCAELFKSIDIEQYMATIIFHLTDDIEKITGIWDEIPQISDMLKLITFE